MKRFWHLCTRAFLLNKRILHQPLFLVLLAMVPVLVLGVSYMASAPSSIVTVAVCPGSPDDQTASAVISDLVSNSSPAVRYYACTSEEEVKEDVISGKARMGCVFPEHLDDLFEAYAAQETTDMSAGALQMLGALFSGDGSEMKNFRILCYVGTNDAISKLTREHLFGRMYPHLEAALVRTWLKIHPEIGTMTAEERDLFVEEALEKYPADYDYFELGYLDGGTISEEETARYLASPMRGLLAALLTLTALAAVLCLCDDLRCGRFVWIERRFRRFFCFGCILLPMSDLGIAVYIALLAGGSFTEWTRELPYLLLYILCAAGFANLLRVVLRRTELIASSVPIILCACLFLTPVFADLKVLEWAQVMIPPYLYLNAIHGMYPAWSMAVYAAVTVCGSLLLDRDS